MRDAYTYLIIGGGVAGVTAAETIRLRDSKGTIAIISSEPHPLYSRVTLPRFVRGEIGRDKVFLRSLEAYAEKNIDFIPLARASFLNVAKRELGLVNQRIFGFEKLLVASGGESAPSNLDGYAEYVYRLQTIDDADRLREALHKSSFKSPAILGGSFMAFEFLSIAAHFGLKGRVITRGEHFFPHMVGSQGGDFLRRIIFQNGFEIVSEDEVVDAAEGKGFLRVTTKRLSEYDHDALFLGIGLKRNIDFLAGSGIETATGVKTNEFLETSVPSVYAAGDVAEFFDPVFGHERIIGNWTNSFLQGKLAGLNMTGERLALRVVSAYSTTHFGLALTALGECRNFDASVERADARKNTYIRYFFKNGVLVGAFLINRNDIRAHASALIESKTPLGEFAGRLKEPSFDISEIPIVKST